MHCRRLVTSFLKFGRAPELRDAIGGKGGARELHISSVCNRAQLIDGKKISKEIYGELRAEITSLETTLGRAPHLALVRIGADPASGTYVRNKIKAASNIGIKSTVHHLPETTSQTELLRLVNQLNNDGDVDGILVQLPLPSGMNERVVCNSVSPEKDVDGFHITNIGRYPHIW